METSKLGEPTRRSLSYEFKRGLMFGLGFSIVAAILFWVVLFVSFVMMRDDAEQRLAIRQFRPDSGLEIEFEEAESTEHNLRILGNIRNAGGDTWDFIRLQAELFDHNGRFVGLCNGHLSFPIHPNESRHFEVDCGGTPRSPVPEHATYKIFIVDASYEYSEGT